MTDRRTIAIRATVVWTPVAAVAIAAVMVLIDFWFGRETWFRLDGSSWVRFFPYDQLYDLALHIAMLAVALAGALIFAAVARKALRASKPSVS